MIFHENRLLADDSHLISCLIFFQKLEKIRQNLWSAAVVIGYIFVIFEKGAKVEIVVCCKLQVAL